MSERGFPDIEKILYSKCASEAGTPVTLAKCVVKLLKIRDFNKLNQNQINFGFLTEEKKYDIIQKNIFDNFKKFLFPNKPESSTYSNKVESSNLTDRLIPIREFYNEKEFKRRRKRELFESKCNVLLFKFT